MQPQRRITKFARRRKNTYIEVVSIYRDKSLEKSIYFQVGPIPAHTYIYIRIQIHTDIHCHTGIDDRQKCPHVFAPWYAKICRCKNVRGEVAR